MLKKSSEFKLHLSKFNGGHPISGESGTMIKSSVVDHHEHHQQLQHHQQSGGRCASSHNPPATRQQDSGLGSTLYPEEEDTSSDCSPASSESPSPAPQVPPVSASAPPLPANPPPNISANLAKGKVIIRPVACRPTPSPGARLLGGRIGERYGSTPSLVHRPGSRLALYGSSNDLRPYGGSSVTNYNSLDRKLTSSSSGRFDAMSPPSRRVGLYLCDPSSNTCSSLPPVPPPPIPHDSGSSSRGSLPPSPEGSDSGELEQALRERDAEIGQLRDTLERNEAAIFTVYEEKERAWERELRKLRALYETRLRASQQKSLRVEQTLASHTYQLQQEIRRLKQDLSAANTESQNNTAIVSELRQELAVLRSRLDDTEWGLCHKSGELALIKAQLKDSQGEQANKSHELINLRAELREAKSKLEASEKQAEQRLAQERAAFQEERLTWLREKEQVLHYQRRLQLNYVHMYRRTRTLESQLEGLNIKSPISHSVLDDENPKAVLLKPVARKTLTPTNSTTLVPALDNHTIEL
ncbi:Hypothetical predicted protein [Cloeon dipterum]|uniref:Uncharacterized protein n=2 Tax=Cloeon dipterum TaxID=197152 RepID=A0A8S1CB12_9INSE|nr:Hypothetical predicted protein [Cloeon dipterum]